MAGEEGAEDAYASRVVVPPSPNWYVSTVCLRVVGSLGTYLDDTSHQSGYVYGSICFNEPCVIRSRTVYFGRRFGGHLSDVLENQVAYCAHNSIVVADIGQRLGILDILGGHSKRCEVYRPSLDFTCLLEAVLLCA